MIELFNKFVEICNVENFTGDTKSTEMFCFFVPKRREHMSQGFNWTLKESKTDSSNTRIAFRSWKKQLTKLGPLFFESMVWGLNISKAFYRTTKYSLNVDTYVVDKKVFYFHQMILK